MSGVTTTIIEVRTSPHLHGPLSVDTIMRNVVYAMLPLAAFSVWHFGLSALVLLTVTTAGCVLAEHLLCRVNGNASTVNDYSAAITGLLLGLTLPPGFPLWMALVGSVVAIAPGKLLFGGLGSNVATWVPTMRKPLISETRPRQRTMLTLFIWRLSVSGRRRGGAGSGGRLMARGHYRGGWRT